MRDNVSCTYHCSRIPAISGSNKRTNGAVFHSGLRTGIFKINQSPENRAAVLKKITRTVKSLYYFYSYLMLMRTLLITILILTTLPGFAQYDAIPPNDTLAKDCKLSIKTAPG